MSALTGAPRSLFLISMGDNSGFGGTVNTSFHEDPSFLRPTLTVIAADGTENILLRNGIPLFKTPGVDL